ncbi:MAG: glycosyltransferase family 2 protein [Caldisericia bacterium]|nr:glycosyltransferase family 2 protein [Caldisericia bacterium]
MIGYLLSQQLNILIFFFLIFLNSFLNLFRIKNLKNVEEIKNDLPKISILIPARNEEKNIERCVKSIINQNYPNFEIFVLNDNSEDRTLEILENLKKEHEKLNIINNKDLKDGWLGKTLALQILYENSNGDVLVFLDADTFHKENAILKAVSYLLKRNLDMLSIFPQEIMGTFLEKLIIPFMNFALMSFYPLLPFANGQFVVFKRETLIKIGGFEKVKDEVLDDIKMVSLLRKYKFKTAILSGKDISFCRMYYDIKSLFMGFLKSYFAIFDYHFLLAIFVYTYLIFSFFYPFIMLSLKYSLSIKEINIFTNIFIIFISYSIFLITYLKFNYPIAFSFLFHLTILINSIIGYLSIIYTLTGKRVWKGRKLPKKRIKLI